jgi:hypothetical protein
MTENQQIEYAHAYEYEGNFCHWTTEVMNNKYFKTIHF